MKRWLAPFLAGAVVTAAFPAAAPGARAEEAPALVAKGRTLLGKGDYPGARDAFLAAVARDGKSVEARRGAAEALLGLGQPDAAVDQAFAGLSLVEDRDAGLWLLAARGFLLKGDTLAPEQTQEIQDAYADAKAKASLALKNDPALHAARAVLAKACRLTDDPDRAAQVLAEGLEKAPKDFDLLFEKGMVHIKKGFYTDALEAFDGAAGSDPRSGEAQFQRGFCLAFLGRWEDSYAAFAKAAILDPSSRKPLQYLAKYAKDKSRSWYREILKERPDHAWAHAYLAYYLAYGKDEAGAVSESKSALALQPEDPDLLAWHGQVLEILGRKPEARGYFVKALQKNPQTKIAWDRLADFATNPGSGAKLDERKEAVEFLGRVRTDDGIFWNNAGLMYRDLAKDYRRSLEAYLKAAALAPGDQGIQNDTGLIYLYHGPSIGVDPALGLPFFERSLALVDEEGQAPEMGYRDTLENLSWFYMTVEKNPEKALLYATKRNDPEWYGTLPKEIAQPSPKAQQVKDWAERELKRR